MSTSAGVFNLKVGSGARAGTDYEDTSTLDQAFDNGLGNVTPLTCDSGTAYDAAPGDARAIRLTINEGTGVIQFSENINMASVPYARYATKLEGHGANDFLSVDGANNIDQTNLQNVFGGGNYTELMNLINGTSAQYADPAGANFTPTAPVDFNNQALQNLADPTNATDAATKNYSDTYIGGAAADSASLSGLAGGADIGKVLTWNGTTWVANTPTATDATKLPLAGGTMTGDIDMGGNDILNSGFITMSANTYLHLGTYATDPPGLTAGHEGVTWYNSTSDELKIWDGAAAQVIGGFDIGTAAGDAMGADAVPNCLASEKLQMSAGPVYAWSCVTDATGGDFESDGSVAMTGNIPLNGNYLSGDGGNEGVFVDATGEVGIGTNNPGSLLEVNGTAVPITTARGLVSINSNSAQGVGVGGTLGFGGSDGVQMRDFANIGGLKENAISGNYAGYLSFATRENGSSPAERLRITSTGDVGIGTTSPIEKLDVEGTIVSGPKGTAAGEGGAIVFEELAANIGAGGIDYVGFRAPDAVGDAASIIWELPAADGTNGQVLQTNGSGVLSWASVGTGDFESDGSVAMSGDLNLNNNGIVNLEQGTNAAPSISFNGDADTGIYSSSANEIAFTTGGTRRFYVTNSGLRGTGTDSVLLRGSNGTEAQPSYSFAADSDTGLYSDTADELTFVTGGADAMTINSSGQVGIGTTTPTRELTVLSAGATEQYNISTAFESSIAVARQNGTVGAPTSVVDNDVIGTFMFRGFENTGGPDYYTAGYIQMEVNGTPSGANIPADMTFWVDSGAGGETQAVKIQKDGKVGIGDFSSSSVQSQLQVDGVVQIDPKGTAAGDGGQFYLYELDASAGTDYVGLRAPDDVTTTTVWTLPPADGTSGQVLSTNGTGQLGWSSLGGGGDFESDGSVAMTGQIDAILGNQGNPGISFGTDANTGFFSPAADNVAITTGGTERVRVTSVGRVGIGVDPSSILHIEGTNPNLQLNGNVDDTNISISMRGYNSGNYNHGFEMVHHDESDNSFQLNRIQAGTSKTVLHAERDTAQLGIFNPSPIGAVHITDDNNRDFYFDGHNDIFNQGPDLILRRSRGDANTLTPVLTGDKVGSLFFHSYDTSSTYRGAAGIQATATADTGANRAPTKLEFITREVGASSTKTQMELGDDGNLNMLDHNRIRLYDTGTNEYVALVAPADVTADTNLTLPNGPGTNGQVLTTDGTGVMSWTTPASGGDFESDGSVAMTGQLDLPDGSAAAPSLSYTNDQDTGFYNMGGDGWTAYSSNGADSIWFGPDYTTFLSSVHINDSINSGYVSSSAAIYTPNAPTLSIENTSENAGAASLAVFSVENSTGTQQTAYIGAVSNDGTFTPELVFGQQTAATGYNESMRITKDLDVGIGTEAPSSRLTVQEQDLTNAIYEILSLEAENGGAGGGPGLGAQMTFKAETSTSLMREQANISSSWTNAVDANRTADLKFNVTDQGVPRTAMSIAYDNYVAIHSSTDLRLEDDSGGQYTGFRAPATVTGSGVYTLPPADGTNGQVLSTNGSGVLSWQSTGAGDFLANGTVSMTGNIRLNGNYLSNDGGSEGVFVDTDGNVGIGNGAPGAKFHVYSGHTVNGEGDLILENNNWSYDMGVRFRQASFDKWHFGFSGNDTEDLHIRNNSGGYFQTWDYSTGYVGIGTAAPEEELHVEGTDTTVAVKVTNTDSTVARYPGFIVDHHKGATILGAPTFAGRTSRGTKALPTETQTGDVLASFVGLGAYNTTPNWHTGGGMEVIAIENFNATDRGTGLRFSVTPSGTTSSENAVLITESGDINLLKENEVRMQDAAGGQYVGFKAPATVTTSQTYTLPAADGSNGEVLTTNGSGVLSWSATGGGSGDVNNNGNSFGATMTIGTNDGFDLEFERNNSAVMVMDAVFLYGSGGTGAASISMAAPGGAAQPSFAFYGDDDTGMYRSGIDEISFATGATERMTLDSTGRLGIGVDPTEELHVRKDQNATTTFRVDNFTAGANADSQMILGTSSANFSFTQISSSSTGTGANSPNSSLISASGTNGLSLSGSNGVSGSISFFTDGSAEANRRMTIDNSGHTNILAEKELRLQDATGGEYVGFKAPATVTGTQTYTLPAADGSNGHVLTTNGSGVLSWSAAGGGSGDFLADGTIPMTGQFTADFGTAAAPGITFDGDEDLGIYRIAADQMAFTAAGSMKFEVNQNRFEGKDFGSAAMRSAAGVEANPAFTFVNDPDTGLFTPASNEIAFSNSGSESLRIDADGDVGIGTAAPDSILHVEPSAAPASTKGKGIKLYAQDSTGPASNTGGSILLEVGDGAGGFGSGNFSADIKSGNFFVTKGKNTAYTPGSAPDHHLFLENSWFVDSNSVFITHNVRNSANDQYFFTGAFSNSGAGTYSPSYAWVQQTGASSYAERMRIDVSGNFGIGTTSPDSLVHIDGSGAGKGLCVTGDGTCSTVPAGGEISAVAYNSEGADYAEYFAAEEELEPGDLVGLNPATGLARGYQKGDALLGIVSTNPGVIGNAELQNQDNVVLVGLVGQLPVQSDQVYYHNGFAYANDGAPLGFALASGNVYINISSTDVQQNSEIAKLKEELNKKDQEIKSLKEKNESLENRMDRLEAMMEALSASSSRAPASVE